MVIGWSGPGSFMAFASFGRVVVTRCHRIIEVQNSWNANIVPDRMT
jgi:hypothetical protein